MDLTHEQIAQLLDLLGRLLAFLALIGGGIVYALRARADSKVKLDTAQTALLNAKANVLTLEAEARTKEADNTAVLPDGVHPYGGAVTTSPYYEGPYYVAMGVVIGNAIKAAA